MSKAEPHDFKFIEILSEAAIIVNSLGVIVLANPEAEALFGYQSGELTGQPLQVLVPVSAQGRHPHQVEHYFAGPYVRNHDSGLRLAGRRRDGSEFSADIVLSPLVEPGGMFTVAMIRAV